MTEHSGIFCTSPPCLGSLVRPDQQPCCDALISVSHWKRRVDLSDLGTGRLFTSTSLAVIERTSRKDKVEDDRRTCLLQDWNALHHLR